MHLQFLIALFLRNQKAILHLYAKLLCAIGLILFRMVSFDLEPLDFPYEDLHLEIRLNCIFEVTKLVEIDR